ncbi:MAG: Gfo/Idh/MocA family oxidoreductase [Planctomycetia bacterium]|nr:Gfo/Idh/MocA family oxidoreductase [Planctomycetia bacterium]
MNLTPKQRAEAREEFLRCSRRDFLKASTAAVAVTGASAGAFYFGYGKAHGEPLRVGVLGTGDEGCVLISAINPEYVQVKAIADIRPFNRWRAFNGDHASDNTLAVRRGLMNVYGWKTEDEAKKHVKVYEDYRELLKNAISDGIEAVIIALPLHLHAEAAIVAMKLGLHVLTEKLMARTVAQCKEMARVSEMTGRFLATGHQRHYNILYEEAVENIRRGVLGDLHYIRAQWHRGNMPGTDSWQQPMPYEVNPKDKQALRLLNDERSLRAQLSKAKGADIDKFTMRLKQKLMQMADKSVDAEKYGYQANTLTEVAADGTRHTVYSCSALEELLRWRLWGRTGGGLMVELGSHQLDAASIFVAALHGGEKQMPISVAASGYRNIFPYDRDTNDHVVCMFEFPLPGYKATNSEDAKKKIGVQYATINGNGFGGYGEIIYGTKGTLILDREQEAFLLRDQTQSKVSASKDAGPTLDTQSSGASQTVVAGAGAVQVSRGYTEEIEHFAWCIRNPAPENQPRCTPKIAMADAIIAHVTNISAKNAQRIYFKPEWFDIHQDDTPEGDVPNLKKSQYHYFG